jgi:predicted PP-loop superfamily ATPase
MFILTRLRRLTAAAIGGRIHPCGRAAMVFRLAGKLGLRRCDGQSDRKRKHEEN